MLPNKSERLSPDEIKRSLSDFEFFMANYAQIVGKDRKTHPFRLNPFQVFLFKELLPLIKKETRLDRHLDICVCKPRQVGMTVSFLAFINYICSFLEDFNNTSILMVEPVSDTINKLYAKKVEPILTGVHPDLMATMERETLGSSILTHYKDIRSVRRNNYFELVSAGASSIRSDTVNIVAFDECGFYAHPEVVSDAAIGSMPDYGFSLTIYMSTFEDRKNDFFKKKLETAIDNPEDWRIIFAPWFILYPEIRTGIPLDSLELTDYDRDVIIPAMVEFGIPSNEWGDCIDWYHRKSHQLANMKKEFPTTLDEVMTLGQDSKVFSEDAISWQREHQLAGTPYRVLTDNFTGKVEAIAAEVSPFIMYQPPQYGRKYKLVVDPITAINDGTDYFAMCVFDDEKMEQVAVFYGNDMPLEDYADYAVSIAKLYNNAMICPESNVAAAFVTSVYGLRYYNFYYETPLQRKNRTPGIRTTATSKEYMIDNLNLLLNQHRIILHDKETIDELGWFEKKIKTRMDGSQSIKMMARKGKKDDLLACLWIYVGSLDKNKLSGQQKVKFAFL